MNVEQYLIRAQDACCADLSGADAYIGVTYLHADPGDGTRHELDVYWRDPPPGKQPVRLVSFDPLTVDGPVACPCGWADQVPPAADGKSTAPRTSRSSRTGSE